MLCRTAVDKIVVEVAVEHGTVAAVVSCADTSALEEAVAGLLV